MDARRRNYFTAIVLGLRGLSECRNPKAAIVIRGEDILGKGYSRAITTRRSGLKRDEYRTIESSPVYEAILQATHCFTGRGRGISGITRTPEKDTKEKEKEEITEKECIILTYFPNPDEIKMLWHTTIRDIYFFGDIDDEESANLINDLIDDESGKNPFNVINLNFS